MALAPGTRFENVLIGLTAGDMLGAPMEFLAPSQVRAEYGVVNGPVPVNRGPSPFAPGEFTDDTQLALCLLAAYPRDEGLAGRARAAMVEWLRAKPRDVGSLTKQALQSDAVSAWHASGRKSCGNGALMRAAASVAAGRTGTELLVDAALLGALTHADPRSIATCVVLCAALEALLRDESYDDAWRAALDAAGRFDASDAVRSLGAKYASEVAAAWPAAVGAIRDAVHAGLRGEDGGNSGFAVTTLQTAVRHGGAPDFAAGVLPIVREGDDADTVAAVAGAVLGARAKVPPDAWLATLRCGERWSAWPAAATGPDAVERLRQACRRAAGLCESIPYPGAIPKWRVSRVHPQVLYGRNPLFAAEVEALQAGGITHVLDLREPFEWQAPLLGQDAFDAFPKTTLVRRHELVRDKCAPSPAAFTAALAFVDGAIESGGVVFVHCRAGVERTGAVVLGWWLKRGGSETTLREHAPFLKPLPDQLRAARALPLA